MDEAAFLAAVSWATIMVILACLIVAAICIMSLLADARARRRKHYGDVFTYNRFWRKRK